jgi:hypothetical protein
LDGRYDFVFVPESPSIENVTGPSSIFILKVPWVAPQLEVDHTLKLEVQ